MRFLKNVTPLLLLTFLAVLPFGAARADESNKLTIFNFSAPVELPGLTLPAGSYTFKLMDNSSDRNIVQVFNKDMTKMLRNFPGHFRLSPGAQRENHHPVFGIGLRSVECHQGVVLSRR